MISDRRNDLRWDLAITSPDRYDSTDLGWAINGDAGKTVRKHLTMEAAYERAIRHRIVDERADMRHLANKFLLEVGLSKAWPDFDRDPLLGGFPIVVTDEHVCLRVVTPTDLDTWAKEQRRAADLQYATVLMACDGAEWAARSMRARGWSVIPFPEVQRS